MQLHTYPFYVAIVASLACAGPKVEQNPPEIAQHPAGLIATDAGGAPGYQHGLEHSRFVTGSTAALRRVQEHGFAKVVGPEGTFATDLRNGLVIAIQAGGANKGDVTADATSKPASVMDPNKHNEQVAAYFVGAGVPRDQIGGVHANTYLSSSGSMKDERPAPVKVDGYASILERKIEKYPVVDSSAWARMDVQGKVVSEWVYWPAIPARVLADARRLEGLVAPGESEFLARLPVELREGKVVIRHSSATEEGPFEVYASYDVLQRKESPLADKSRGNVGTVSVAVRHFDVSGAELRLPQERRNMGSDFPPKPLQTANSTSVAR
jgi:hypothetical protein